MTDWVRVSAERPAPGKKVLAWYKNALGKPRIICAIWVPKKSRDCDTYPFEEGAVYDEDNDVYYWPEGWYECIDNWDDFTHVAVTEGEVSWWIQLPEGPGHHG